MSDLWVCIITRARPFVDSWNTICRCKSDQKWLKHATDSGNCNPVTIVRKNAFASSPLLGNRSPGLILFGLLPKSKIIQ